MKRLDPSIHEEEEEDSDSDDDDDDDKQGEEAEEGGADENAPARANVGGEQQHAQQPAEEGLGSIAVKDGPGEQKREELRAFLETELPEIQRSVALRARTLWWKQREYDDKLEDARRKLQEVQRLIEAVEPGIPSMAMAAHEGAAAVVPTV